MGWFSDDSAQQADQYNSISFNNDGSVPEHHKASLTHEALGAAAAYEAAKAYENHLEKNGEQPSHAKAKEFMAGIAGAFVDRELETRGADYYDKEKAQREAKQYANSQIQDSNYPY